MSDGIVPGNVLSPVLEYLESLHARFADHLEGDVATYIPELAKANGRWFGICLATTDGQVYEVGDTRLPFTIQSISKPFVYAAALEEHGREAVLRKIGVEPSGDAFNAISLDPVSGRPANPMINAGAIAATGMLPGNCSGERWDHLLGSLSRYVGHALCVDEAVYTSERETGFRNQAIAFLLRNAGVLEGDPLTTLDLYFRQCAVLVNCRDLAVMAATLAAGGVNPLTGVRALGADHVESVLSMMGSCGMYDFAGEWSLSVGLPAKSGVSGGILAVLPGHLGIGVFSPLLDTRGNSVRGIEVFRELSQRFGLHLFNVPQTDTSVIHRAYGADEVPSNRVRPPAAAAALQRLGRRIRVYELAGALSFGTVEVVVRDVLHNVDSLDFVILDLERVTESDFAAGDLLSTLALRLAEREKRLIFTGQSTAFASALRTHLAEKSPRQNRLDYPTFQDIDFALEWCEDELLSLCEPSQNGNRPANGSTIPPEAFELLAGLETAEKEALLRIVRPRCYRAGEVIVKAGDPEDALYLLTRGEATVVVPLLSGREKRLATLSAGMTFGEMAVLERSLRSATVYADQDAECHMVLLEDLNRLWDGQPRMKAVMLQNLASDLSRKLRKMNSVVRALAR